MIVDSSVGSSPYEDAAPNANEGRVSPVGAMTEPLTALVVTSEGHTCALPLEHVREVMRPQPLESTRSDLRFVEGLAMIRGEPTPVVNLGLLLGGTAERSCAGRLVTLKVGARTVAVAVNSVRGVYTLDARAFTELPPLLSDLDAGYVERLARLDTEFVLLLRTARLVPDPLGMDFERRGDAE